MNREELGALQDAIATILAWPPAVFNEVVRWLTPSVLVAARREPNVAIFSDLRGS